MAKYTAKAKIKLTRGRVDAFACDTGKPSAFLWDSETKGFGVKANAGGSKVFVFQGDLDGRDIRITIGSAAAWSLDTAREEARRLQRLLDQGTDPRLEKQERLARQEAQRDEARMAQSPALEAWNAYLADRTTRWSLRTLLDHQRMSSPGGKKKTRGRKKGESDVTQPGILLAVLSQPLKTIDAPTLRAWLKDEATRRPTQARNAFVRLRAFINWCADRPEYAGQVNADACASRIARDELPKKAAKDDCLQREQLAAWFTAVREIDNPVIAVYLQTLLLTGARRDELANLRWADVDFKWKGLGIADKVEAGGRVIPLTPYVAQLLTDLKRRNDTPPPRHRILHGKKIENDLENWEPSPWVFSSPTARSGRIQEPRIQHNRALLKAGLPPMTLHGLRRSFGTLAEWTETPVGIVAQIMGHKPSALAEKHYRRRPLDLLRMWHTRIEAWMLEQADIAQPAEDQEGLKLVQR